MFALDLLCFEQPYRFDFETMTRFAHAASSIVMIAESTPIFAGFVIATMPVAAPDTSAYVVTLDVDPALRRQGIARHLLDAVENAASACGAHSIKLHVAFENTAAISFYRRRGYSATGIDTEYYGDGRHAYVYTKSLLVV